MEAVVISKTKDSVTFEITVRLAESMLEGEENITAAINEAGRLASELALEQSDTDGSPIMLSDAK